MSFKGAVLIGVVSLLLAWQAIPLSVAASSGVPSVAVGLALTIIPPKLPADNGTYGAVVISLVDSSGLPSAAISDLTVFLTSSQTNIAKVPDSVTIRAGSEYVVANATTTPTPGSTTITASSHGLGSSFAQLTTATPSGFPSILRVLVSPSSFLRRPDTGTVRVELVDSAGSPSKAITSVTAHLSSSNASRVSLNQNSLTISPGQIYATGTFNTSVNSGQAVITASSTGFGSGGAIVTVVPPNYCSSSCAPSKLLLKLVPGTLPTDGRAYSALEVDLATSTGQPAVSSSDTIVQLFSDEPDVVSVPAFVAIPAGNISVLTMLTTSSLQGHSSITASSSSLLSGNVNVTTVIPAPSKLQAYLAPPSTFVATKDNRPILVIQLQDGSGNPARARVLTNITVTSSDSSMVRGPLHVGVKAGQDYAYVLLVASGSGQSVLTASSQGLSSSQVTLQLAVSPPVDQLSATLPNGLFYSNDTATLTLTVSFLGQPVQNMNVSWTATMGSISPTTVLTSLSGSATTKFTPITTDLLCMVVSRGVCYYGTAKINASASSPVTGPISVTYPIAIYQTPPPVTYSWYQNRLVQYLIVAAVVVAAVALYYLFRMRRKKQRAEIEAGFEVV